MSWIYYWLGIISLKLHLFLAYQRLMQRSSEAQDRSGYGPWYKLDTGILIAAVDRATDWFEEYAAMHTAKGSLDKAAANLEKARWLEQQVEQYYGGEKNGQA